MAGRTVVFDVETHSSRLLYTMPPEEFVRLAGYKWADESEVHLTTDINELREVILSARWVIGHNIHAFDLKAVFGPQSDIPLELADEGRVYDTWVHAPLVLPAPSVYTNRFGAKSKATKPEELKKFYGLDELAHQLGVAGKTDNLKDLANRFPAEGYSIPITGSDRSFEVSAEEAAFGAIPVDDPDYREYLRGDVLASEAVARALLKHGPLDEYAMREQRIAARAAVISSNGVRVDIQRAEDRVAALAARREEIMTRLQRDYGMPSDGLAPWDTDQGKKAIMRALADCGITPDTVDWPKTPLWEKRDEELAKSRAKEKKLREDIRRWKEELENGGLPKRSLDARRRWISIAEERLRNLSENPLPPAFGLSLSGETLTELTKGTPAEDLGRALAELKGQRSLAQLTLDSLHPDGKVHPQITMLQRSGRWSTTEPGLTVWGSRTKALSEDKAYFIPDSPDEALLEIDYSNADARVVAWLSGDRRYAERFEPGADGHLINAWAAWGRDFVGEERDENGELTGKTKVYRDRAKAPGHGWNYNMGPVTMSKTTGIPLEECKRFKANMDSTFSRVTSWKKSSIREAQRTGYVTNPWGRKMFVEKGREFTQAPALKGQSGTREVVCDALLSFSYPALRKVKAQIHDALLFSVPRARFEECKKYLLDKMVTNKEATPGGQPMEFPAKAGPPGDNWQDAAH